MEQKLLKAGFTNFIKLTDKGFKYYGAIGSLFYSNKHKQYLIGSEKIWLLNLKKSKYLTKR